MSFLASALSSKNKFLIFGGGFTGKFFASKIRSLGCIALTSTRIKNDDKKIFFFDSDINEMPSDEIFDGTTHVLSCIPPSKNGQDPVLGRLKRKLKTLNLQWAGYLSTTGVYGNTSGSWVSENDPAKPLQPRSKRRLMCEKEWLNSDLPSQIFRLPGIYGPGRSSLDSIIKNTIKVIEKPNQVFSRIHVADITGTIIYLLQNKNLLTFYPIINVADNYPCSQIEVIKYSYELLGLNMPNPIKFAEAKNILSPIALSFWEENRRISNKLLCQELGYNLIYKDYKSGIKNCLENI